MGLTVDISFVLGLDLDLLTDGGVRVAFHCSQPDHCLVVQFGTPQEALKGEGSAWAFQPQGLGASQELRGQLGAGKRSEEHTSELQSRSDLVCRLLLEKKKKKITPQPLSCRTLVDLVLYLILGSHKPLL